MSLALALSQIQKRSWYGDCVTPGRKTMRSGVSRGELIAQNKVHFQSVMRVIRKNGRMKIADLVEMFPNVAPASLYTFLNSQVAAGTVVKSSPDHRPVYVEAV